MSKKPILSREYCSYGYSRARNKNYKYENEVIALEITVSSTQEQIGEKSNKIITFQS